MLINLQKNSTLDADQNTSKDSKSSFLLITYKDKGQKVMLEKGEFFRTF
jgi:hypothetical protein